MEKCDLPLFSIVTVCYNSEKTIERTLKSVLAQQYTNYEYIIVDGGSTDKTLDIIKKYEPLFEGRMKWKSEPDKGIYDAFNKGILRSHGIYVWIVNSDDYICSNALKDIEKIIQTQKGRYSVISGAMNIIKDEYKVERVTLSSEREAKRSYNMDDIGIKHPATLIPQEVYKIVGLYDSRFNIVGDMDWFQRAYGMGIPFAFIDLVLTNMRDNGISNTYTKKVFDMRDADMRLLFNKKYSSNISKTYHYVRWKIRITLRFIKHILLG